MDAYEWSFVAVPAQREAGVLKRFRQEPETAGEGAALLRRRAGFPASDGAETGGSAT